MNNFGNQACLLQSGFGEVMGAQLTRLGGDSGIYSKNFLGFFNKAYSVALMQLDKGEKILFASKFTEDNINLTHIVELYNRMQNVTSLDMVKEMLTLEQTNSLSDFMIASFNRRSRELVLGAKKQKKQVEIINITGLRKITDEENKVFFIQNTVLPTLSLPAQEIIFQSVELPKDIGAIALTRTPLPSGLRQSFTRTSYAKMALRAFTGKGRLDNKYDVIEGLKNTSDLPLCAIMNT